MKRIRRRKAQENIVKLAIDILEDEVGPKFNSKKYLSKLYIHKQVNNKYHKMFVRVVEYLEELRGDYKNPIELVIEDYFSSIYERHSHYGKVPNLMHLSPSTNNRIKFEEMIHDFPRENGEEYWTRNGMVHHEIIEVGIETAEVPNLMETGEEGN